MVKAPKSEATLAESESPISGPKDQILETCKSQTPETESLKVIETPQILKGTKL